MTVRTNELFGEAIYVYTRAQAIQDGVLVDLSQFPVTRQHWRHHVACTSGVWAIIERATEQTAADVEGTLHDIFHMAKLSIRGATDRIQFQVRIGGRVHSMWLHCGPGDDETPVITLMLQGED